MFHHFNIKRLFNSSINILHPTLASYCVSFLLFSLHFSHSFSRALPKMVLDHHNHHVICSQRLSFIIISLLLLIVSSWTQLGLASNGFHQMVDDNKAMVRAQIGSRPPRCETRCKSCGHCEAIQVPTNPQPQNGKINPSRVSKIAYARGEYSSNYKPLSWKCKCGNIIFNP